MGYFKAFNKKLINKKFYIPFPFIDIYYFRWGKLKEIPIHDQACRGCIMILLKGTITEKLFNKNIKLIKEKTYTSPNISFINNNIGYHSIRPNEISRSLHFYYPKGHKTKYFNSNKHEINSIYNSN